MNVCTNCFNDTEIRSYIDTNSSELGDCECCNAVSVPLLLINELLDFFIELLDLYKTDLGGSPLIEKIESDWNLFSSIEASEIILSSIIELSNHPLENISNQVSFINDIVENVSYWTVLKENIKWERRFLFELENLKDHGWDNFFNEQAQFTNTQSFYRARIHHLPGQPTMANHELGSPDKVKAGGGRANPQGIPYLYLSKSVRTTLYETRAIFQDELSVGEFKVKIGETINLVDFTAKASSFLGQGNLKNHTKSILLKERISKDLSKPIRRYDSDIEYIPTQFICEFLRYIIGSDGIIFNSSLDLEGQNIVLFDQDKMECTDVKKCIISNLDIEFEIVS